MRHVAVENFLKRHPEGKLAMVAPEIKATNDEHREILHLISTDSVDRVGDIVEPGGAMVDNYLKNPVVLQDHDYTVEKIIGGAVRLETEDGKMWARTRFMDTERGQMSYNLSKAGLGGWSIGFKPRKAVAIEDEKGHRKGIRFKEWELLEYSHVAIPMNQDAVNHAVARGLCSKEFINDFFEIETPEPEPSQVLADHGPTATVQRLIEPHPALIREVARATKRLALHRLAEEIRKVTKGLNNG